jgi:putative glutamine amidotransferase
LSPPPAIAVVAYHLAPGRVTRWPEGGYGVPGPYIDAVRRAGARTVLLAPGGPGDPVELLSPFDGLLLVGGGDVDPPRYGGVEDGHVYGVEPDRDELELALVHAADDAGMPALCICRGFQVMNVAFGGTLHPHLPDLEGAIEHGVPVADEETVHAVRVESSSRLGAAVGEGSIACSSHHHQGVDRVGDGLRPTAWSEDGLVEGLEREGDTWFVGVQWHPEDTAATDPRQQALFDTFVRVVEAVE